MTDGPVAAFMHVADAGQTEATESLALYEEFIGRSPCRPPHRSVYGTVRSGRDKHSLLAKFACCSSALSGSRG